MTPPRIELRGVGRRFGGLQAVADVTCATQAGEIFGVIGPNGAGKTTLFNLIAGIYRPSSGRILLDGNDISGASSDAVARGGISRTFQNVHAFRDATVRENLRRAALLARSHAPLRHALRLWRREGREENADIERVAGFVGLAAALDIRAGNLAYGSKKVLGVGMALMSAPRVMLMDEPAAGLNPTEKLRLGEVIRRIRDELRIDVLLVEHDMRLVMSVCDRILVLDQGRAIAVGTPASIRAEQAVIDAYLGVDYEFA